MTRDREGAAASGLARWRRRQAEEKRERMAVLRELRKAATVEEIDGRRFKVVRIPDGYGWESLRPR